jgi:adenylate cyclase
MSPGTSLKTPAVDATDLLANEAFDRQLTREIIRSECRRLSIVAMILGLGLVRWIAGWVALALGREEWAPGRSSLWMLAVVGGLALSYELYAVYVASTALQRARLPTNAVRYRNAFVETSLPTAFFVLSVAANSPPDPYIIPVASLYLAFILLSTFHLDFWLCAFTGLVAGAEYAWLYARYLNVPEAAVLDPGLMSPVWPAIRVGLLVGCGLIAGVIGLRIRRHFATALRSVQERDRIVSKFGQHVSPAVVEQLLNQDVELKSELRHVCVMFLDIQAFTTFAESRRPRRSSNILTACSR